LAAQRVNLDLIVAAARKDYGRASARCSDDVRSVAAI
jgi:hypothetical protein